MLALFPLNIVVFPFETLNLHIHEPRYLQLFEDLENSGKDLVFGIPPFFDEKVQQYGTLMRFKDVICRYEDGKMDLTAVGVMPFKLKSFHNPIAYDKIYPGGEIDLIPLVDQTFELHKNLLIERITEFYSLLQIKKTPSVTVPFPSFEYGHNLGLSVKQETIMLGLASEQKRVDFLLEHMANAIPLMREVERVKEKIKFNGHFRTLDELDY